MSNPFPVWVSVAAAARQVGRPPATVWTWVHRGHLVTHRIDRQVYVNVIEVAQVAEQRQPRSAAS